MSRVLRSGQLAQGEKVLAFESSFADLVGAESAIAVNSGTSALHLGLLASGVGPGDEVIVPSFTFAASANSVALTGATPVFVDVDPLYFTIDPVQVAKAITKRTKAVMAVHLFGQMADMEALSEICSRFGLLLFEDAAQSHGAHDANVPAGKWGTFAAFSFYPTKNMTSGEGGMITTSKRDVEKLARLLRNQGMVKRYEHEVVGFNNRMTEIHAAIGIEQLKRLPKMNEQRRRNAKLLSSLLQGLPGVRVPTQRPGSQHVWHQFTVLVEGRRDSLRERLSDMGVSTGIYYPTPVHLLESFKSSESLPVSEKLAQECLSLPVGPHLRSREVERLSAKFRLAIKAL